MFEWLIQRSRFTSHHRAIAAHISSVRRASPRKLSRVARNEVTTYSQMEMDSHADTAVLGRNCVILNYTGRECDVSPYTDSYEAIKGVSIVTGATAWTSNVNGQTYILVFHEALWMGDVLEHSLLNPNQLRHYGVVVQDNPYDETEMHLETEDGELVFPLQANGTTISLPTRTPTARELHESPHVIMTSKKEWDPRDLQFPEPLDRAGDERSQLRISSSHMRTMELDPDTVVERIIAEIRVDMLDDVPTRQTFVSKERHLGVPAQELSDRWCIGLKQAENTIRVTTQTATRSETMPLSRRYCADRVFEHPALAKGTILYRYAGWPMQVPGRQWLRPSLCEQGSLRGGLP